MAGRTMEVTASKWRRLSTCGRRGGALSRLVRERCGDVGRLCAEGVLAREQAGLLGCVCACACVWGVLRLLAPLLGGRRREAMGGDGSHPEAMGGDR